jgi:hypothetical protein
VVCVDGAEGGQAVADNSEERDEDIVDYVYYVGLFRAKGYPANEEEDPGCAEEGY